MEEELIKYKTAELAKEVGFNIYQNNQYSKNVNPTTIYNYSEGQCRLYNDTYYAPTQSLLQKWLREKYKIILYVIPLESKYNPDIEGYQYIIHATGIHRGLWNTYEEALEEGLYQALLLINNK